MRWTLKTEFFCAHSIPRSHSKTRVRIFHGQQGATAAALMVAYSVVLFIVGWLVLPMGVRAEVLHWFGLAPPSVQARTDIGLEEVDNSSSPADRTCTGCGTERVG